MPIQTTQTDLMIAEPVFVGTAEVGATITIQLSPTLQLQLRFWADTAGA